MDSYNIYLKYYQTKFIYALANFSSYFLIMGFTSVSE